MTISQLFKNNQVKKQDETPSRLNLCCLSCKKTYGNLTVYEEDLIEGSPDLLCDECGSPDLIWQSKHRKPSK